MIKKAIVYHDNCNDGFCSMCVAMKAFKFDMSVEKIPATYGQEAEILNKIEQSKSQEILFVDFSFLPDAMEKLLPKVQSVRVIDHHKTTLNAYQNNINKTVNGFQIGNFQQKCELVLDMNRSGALMTWDFFNTAPAPKLVSYVSDGDLYQFKDSATIPFLNRLSLEKYELSRWNEIIKFSEEEVVKFIKEGALLSQQFESICESFMRDALPLTITLNEKQYKGDLVLCGSANLRSMVGELIYKKNKTFAAIVSVLSEDTVNVSLRSSNKTDPIFNVREIAEFFGGGGHDTAAAFKTDLKTFQKHFSYGLNPSLKQDHSKKIKY